MRRAAAQHAGRIGSVSPDLFSELRGVLALAALLLLPGLVIVRAPWTAVPFLSASWWILSWWWLPARTGRRGFVVGMLVAFAVLASLRLLKPLGSRLPSWPVVLVLAAAAVRLVPFGLWPVAPGVDMSLHSLSTLLMVWRDGIPVTYEPLLPIHAFGAYDPGLHGLAADVALLSGLPAHRTAFLVSVAAYALLQVALFALLSRVVGPRAAALAAVAALGMARVPQSFLGWGGNPSVLSLSFLVAAAALLARGTGRSPAVAAGVFLGAAVEVQPALAAASALCAPLALSVVWRAPDGRAAAERFAVAASVAAVSVAPFLLRLDLTLSPGEWTWLGDHLRQTAAGWQRYAVAYPLAVLRYVIVTLNDAFLLAALTGFALGWRRRSGGLAATGLAAFLLVGLAAGVRWGGVGPFVVPPEQPMALLAVLLSVGVAVLVDDVLGHGNWIAALGVVALLAVGAERTHRYYFGAASTVMVSADDLAAMAWIRDHTRALEVVCNDDRTAGVWVPALAQRGISSPKTPFFYADEVRRSAEGRPCALSYASDRWFFGPPAPQRLRGRVVFESGAVRILQNP